MKRKILHNALIAAILFLSFNATAQLITTTTGATADQLVRQSLDNDCVQISNITSPKLPSPLTEPFVGEVISMIVSKSVILLLLQMVQLMD